MPAIASKSYEAGNVIFEYKPILHCIADKFKGKHCDNCLKKSKSLKKCSKCLKMFYCSKECQQMDWKYHKNECKVFRHKDFDMDCLKIDGKFMLRLWLCVITDPNFVKNKYQKIDGSVYSLSDIDFDGNTIIGWKKVDPFKGLAILSTHFWKWGVYDITNHSLTDFESHLLTKLWFITHSYKYMSRLEYFSDDMTQLADTLFSEDIGIALFAVKPDLSHSCVPNSDIISNGLKFEVRALKPIESGEQITRSLVNLRQNKTKRHKELGELYFRGVCECDKCTLHLDKDIDYKDFRKLLLIHYRVSSFLKIPPLLSEAIKSKVFAIDWELFMYFRAVYGENSLSLSEVMVLSFISFALYSSLSSKSLLKLWYKRIEPSVRITHGTEHPIYKQFIKVYNKFT